MTRLTVLLVGLRARPVPLRRRRAGARARLDVFELQQRDLIHVDDVDQALLRIRAPSSPSSIRPDCRASRPCPMQRRRRERPIVARLRDSARASPAYCSGDSSHGLTSSTPNVMLRERFRLGRERLRRPGLLAGHVALRHRPLFDRPQRLAGHAVEHVQEARLAGMRDRVDLPAVVLDRDRVAAPRRCRDPTDRDGPSGNARAACPCAHRARGCNWRRGSRRGDPRRRSHRSPSRSARRRCPRSSSTDISPQLLAPPTYL